MNDNAELDATIPVLTEIIAQEQDFAGAAADPSAAEAAEVPPSTALSDSQWQALEHKISIAPGVMFSPKEHYRNFIRLNCASPWSDKTDHALLTLGRLVSV